jgi:hypothetical protein
LGYTPIIASPNLDVLFGAMPPEAMAAVSVELLKADAAIVRIAQGFGLAEQQHYENVATKNRLGLHTRSARTPDIDGCVSSAIVIDNEDGTTSHGDTDLGFTIDAGAEAEGEPRTWDVTVWVAVNCDRRHCADDPHEVLRIAGKATSPIEAAVLLTREIEDVHRWLANHDNDGWRIFRHQEGSTRP